MASQHIRYLSESADFGVSVIKDFDLEQCSEYLILNSVPFCIKGMAYSIKICVLADLILYINKNQPTASSVKCSLPIHHLSVCLRTC